MDQHARDAAALCAVFGHTHDLRDTAPLLAVLSPVKRCGKTRLQRVFKRIVPRPLMTSGSSPAFMARLIEKWRPFLLLDELDALLKGNPEMVETVRGQFDSSFDRDSAQIGKCVPLPGGGYDERLFSTWAPTMFAAIGEVPDTVRDRSIPLRIKRKLPGEKVARFRGIGRRRAGRAGPEDRAFRCRQ
jgi:hypothetical protein